MAELDWLIARPLAHRGLHDEQNGIIENTVSAFAAAITGRYGIECDLQISGDGEAMVYHDDALGRLSDGKGRLDAMTAAELKRVPFRATADRMMTLGELCDFVAGRATLLLELKSPLAADRRLAARAAKVLSGYGGQAAVMSFDPAQIADLRAIAPRLTRGIAVRNHAWAEVAATPRQFIAYSIANLPALLPTVARNLFGLPLLAWTVRSTDDQRKAARYADQMIFEGFRP
jgi:glycerophosphoryl diester phosphodiesterase